MTTIALAILIGGAFGFALDRVGATNPDYIIGMLRLSRLHLMKTILLAIGVASALMFAGLLVGVIDPGHLSVKTTYIGVLIGGALLGIGFAVAGYCPGTGLAGAATGRKDGWFFVLGGLVGAAAYMASHTWVASTGALTEVFGGKSTIGAISGAKFPALLGGVPGEWIGIAVGLAFIGVAFTLPSSLRGRGQADDAAGEETLS